MNASKSGTRVRKFTFSSGYSSNRSTVSNNMTGPGVHRLHPAPGCVHTDRKPHRVALCTSGFAYGVVGILAVACYANSLDGELVHDDIVAIVKNPDVRGESSIVELFLHDFWGQDMSSNRSHKSYRPITVLTFRLNFYTSGLRTFGYHVTNVLLHAVATLLFMYLCRHVIEFDCRTSAIAAAMFAVQPIHTEAVAGIVGRADVLSCIFFLVSVILHSSSLERNCSPSVDRRRRLLFAGSLVSASFSVLSKETGYSAFLVCFANDVLLLLSDTDRRKRSSSDRPEIALRMIATVATLMMSLYLRGRMMSWSLPVFTEDDNPASFHPDWTIRFMTYLYVIGLSIWLTANPSLLSYDWTMGSISLVRRLTDVRNLTTLLIFIATFASGFMIFVQGRKGISKHRPLVFGYLVMILSYLPTTNLFYRVGFVIAERLLYIPSCGFIILLAYSLQCICLRMRKCRPLIYACVAILLTSHATRTVIRNRVWKTRESLFRSGVQSKLDNGKLYYNYGNLLRDKGHISHSAAFYREAIRKWPSYASAKNNLGTIVTESDQAESLYREALEHQPCHANALFNLGNLLRRQSELDRAVLELWEAATCDRRSSLPHSSLAAIYRQLRVSLLAEWHYLKAIQLAPPRRPNVYYNYVEFLKEQGRNSSSSQYCQLLAESINAQPIPAHEDCARPESGQTSCEILSFNSKFGDRLRRVCENVEFVGATESSLYVSEVQRISWQFATKHSTEIETERNILNELSEQNIKATTIRHWSDSFGSSGRHDKAVAFLENCLTRNFVSDESGLGLVHYELARHLQDSNRNDEAFKHYQKAVENNPHLPDANHRVAIFYHLKGRIEDAEKFYITALQLEPNNKLVFENLSKLIRMRRTQSSDLVIGYNYSDKTTEQSSLDRSHEMNSTVREQAKNKYFGLTEAVYNISAKRHISRSANTVTETTMIR